MRDIEQDRKAISLKLKQAGIDELVYIAPNHYDGGYEVRVGTQDIFIEYAALDANDSDWVKKLRN